MIFDLLFALASLIAGLAQISESQEERSRGKCTVAPTNPNHVICSG